MSGSLNLNHHLPCDWLAHTGFSLSLRMSSDPPPPDNPPPPTIIPLGQPLVEAASPTSHPSAISAPSEPPSEDFRQAFALSQRVLQLGPT